MTTKDICEVHYLSCVEAYFGAWIKNFIELPLLYAESFISWNDILKSFQNPSVNYANFSLIPRIQDFAERIGIVAHRKEQGVPRGIKKGELVLLSVKENFFSKQKPWRSDHYIAVERVTAKSIKYLNEYPLESGELLRTEFNDKFGGNSLIYTLCSAEMDFAKKSDILQCAKPTNLQHFCPSELPLQRVRDAIGVLRVSRRRTVAWLDWYTRKNYVPNKEKIRETLLAQIKYADNSYFRLQSMIVRNGQIVPPLSEEVINHLATMEINI